MLNQLFEYARIEAGELALEPEELNVGNLFAETISLFYNDFVESAVELLN
jgi:signal transduction histidine kinase